MGLQLERVVGPVLVLLLLTENGSSAFRHSIQFPSRPTSSYRRAVNGEHDDQFAEPQNSEQNFPFFAAAKVNGANGSSAANNGSSVNGKVNGATLNGKVNGAVVNGKKINGEASTLENANGHTSGDVIDVVLFGVGDLRVDDHIGLKRAIQSEDSSSVLPLCLLEPQQLAQIPGATAHTADTAQLLAAALDDLDASLQDELDLNLVVEWVDNQDDEDGDDKSCWEDVVVQTVREQRQAENSSTLTDIKEIRVHVCDLGTVDNEMGYGAYSKFLQTSCPKSERETDIPVSVVPWHQDLREEPWEELEDLPDQYPDYKAKYATASEEQEPIKPFDMSSVFFDASQRAYVSEIKENLIPKRQEIQQALEDQLGMDPARTKAEERSGLYATHWGGLDAQTVGSSQVLSILTAYTRDCREDDMEWDLHPSYIDRHCKRNGRSLEHAAMTWQLRGDGTSPAGNPNNWLAGESMVRFLAAPLLLGTISPRRIWHSSTAKPFMFTSPLKNLVEGREWHRLLAARCTLRQQQQQDEPAMTSYKYWRYHGFLCRYAQTELERQKAFETSASSKEGILLVHGFGASGAQWDKVMQELASELQTTATATRSSGKSVASQEGLAPDMLGFGHSEKPAISYTGYLWDAMMMDFIKDVAQPKHGWKSYVAGGNSIGGFTTMSMAASDMATISGREVSSSGAPGTNSCTGLLLMNTAGPVESCDQVKPNQESAAQALARDGLPPCQPPPRPLSRIFGHALMAYLRPRIGSICKNLYPTNPDAVDDKLCETIHRDSLDPGAIHVMMAGSKLPPARTANEMLAANFGGAPADTHGSLPESTFSGPVLVTQGLLDPLFDAKSRMERFGSLRPGIEMAPLNAGHCPHDEVPSHVAQTVAAWLSRSRTARRARLSETVLEKQQQVASSPSVMSSSLAMEVAGATNMTLATN